MNIERLETAQPREIFRCPNAANQPFSGITYFLCAVCFTSFL